MTTFRRTLDHARAASALTRARPAYAAGLRAAVATVVPLIVAQALHLSGGTWMSLAGLNSAFADRGGAPYRTRAAAIAALAVTSAVAVTIAGLVAGHPVLAVVVALLVAFAGILARVWGDAATSVGLTSLLTFVIALGLPAPDAVSAVQRGAFVLVGGGWYMLLSLVLWPIRPYTPVRRAVAACYRAVADYADAMGARAFAGASLDAWEARDHVLDIRQALEQARTALAVARRGRPAESSRGERLLVLHETIDQLFVHLVALLDAQETTPASARQPGCDALVAATLADAAATLRAIADAVVTERATPRIEVAWRGAPVRDCAAGSAGEGRVHYDHVARLLDRMAEYASSAAGLAGALNDGRPVAMPDGMLMAEEPAAARAPLTTLRAALSPQSLVLRHALRVAVITAVALLLTGALGVSHGYWVTITAIIILQPYTGATTLKAMQRVAGTVLGGIIAAGLSAMFHDPRAVLALVFVFTGLCVALLPLNYGVFAVFGTPAFVLLAEVGAGDWHLTGVRVINTLIGGALALVGSRVFGAAPESERFAEYAARALAAKRDYLRRAVAVVVAGEPVGALREARRASALASANAEDSFQRLVVEHRGPAESLEPRMAVLTYLRRIAASTGALALVQPVPPEARAALTRFERTCSEIFDDLEDAVAKGRPPRPLPDLGGAASDMHVESPLLEARMARILRQLRSLHDAAEHWLGGVAGPVGDAEVRSSVPAGGPEVGVK
jgi:uncharacterized membrane protein YccC